MVEEDAGVTPRLEDAPLSPALEARLPRLGLTIPQRGGPLVPDVAGEAVEDAAPTPLEGRDDVPRESLPLRPAPPRRLAPALQGVA